MIHALKPLPIEPAPDAFTSAHENPAVAKCSQAWHRAFASSRKKKCREEDAIAVADLAYCKTMPPLVGFENIRNFVACVGYGMLTEIFVERRGTKLLYAAQVAFNAGSRRPKKYSNTLKSGHKSSVSSLLAPKFVPPPLPADTVASKGLNP